MNKYLTIFNISWQGEFTYRLNFILWRFRNVLKLLMTYFLWSGIFVSTTTVFGYQQSQILTYIFLVLFVQTLVLSAPSADNIGNEIGNGDLSNYLVKPVNYLHYWFTRDLASKLLNLMFASIEFTVLLIWLKPHIQFPNNLITIVGFLIACMMALVTYFFVNVTTRFVAFWTPENTWPISFLVLVLLEILSGSMFPLDILPKPFSIGLQFTPFPYLVYYPVSIFIGKITGWEIARITLQSAIWVVITYLVMQYFWKKGLAVYGAEGN